MYRLGLENHIMSFILLCFIKKKEKLCFYLYGEVGVGKTMLLNFAFERLKIRKHRQNFNEFMKSSNVCEYLCQSLSLSLAAAYLLMALSELDTE